MIENLWHHPVPHLNFVLYVDGLACMLEKTPGGFFCLFVNMLTLLVYKGL